MLIEFRVENHRSLRDEQVLTMEAGRVGASDDPRPRAVAGHASALLPVAGLYGANASGKSNVLDALDMMKVAVIDSHRLWVPGGGVPQDPYAWGGHDEKPSRFEMTFLVDGVRYRYGFVTDDERFLEEWLYAWPHGRRQTWLERDDDGFKFGEHLHGENRLIAEVTRPNALFLSTAAQHHHQQLGSIHRWFRSVLILGDSYMGGSVDQWIHSLLDHPTSAGESLDAVLELLRMADVGIVGLDLKEQLDEVSRRQQWRPHRRVMVRHEHPSKDAWLVLYQESEGTQRILELARPVLRALSRGGLVIVDELESSIHPLVAQWLVKRFNDPRTNPRNAQLLFSTHDTNLLGTSLGEPVLRRDQVWLTEKDREGATVIYPLTDYKPRKSENLERGYLQGRYGAIPFLGEWEEGAE